MTQPVRFFLECWGLLNSPFKAPKLWWHLGRVRVGVPVYYPRKRVGFDFVPLKWKTKFGDTDYIFEWAPVMSFVFFKWQIAAVIQAPLTEDFAYWEAWLYYTRDTDKSKSTQERVKQCREQFSLTYIKGDGITEQKVDYYPEVLKSEYV